MENFPTDTVEELIIFHQEDIEFSFEETTEFTNWIRAVIDQENCTLNQLTYIFCSDTYLHQLNVEYLDHDTLTDVITFPYAEPPEVEGDIFISIDRIQENADKFQTTFLHELARVMIHGVLHLCGYGDKTESEQMMMRNKENAALEMVINYNVQL